MSYNIEGLSPEEAKEKIKYADEYYMGQAIARGMDPEEAKRRIKKWNDEHENSK